MVLHRSLLRHRETAGGYQSIGRKGYQSFGAAPEPFEASRNGWVTFFYFIFPSLSEMATNVLDEKATNVLVLHRSLLRPRTPIIADLVLPWPFEVLPVACQLVRNQKQRAFSQNNDPLPITVFKTTAAPKFFFFEREPATSGSPGLRVMPRTPCHAQALWGWGGCLRLWWQCFVQGSILTIIK